MQKKFLSSLLVLLGLNLLIKPFWVLGIDREVQNLTGSSEYGLYFAMLNFSFMLNILLDAGITNFNNRNIAQNEQLLNKYFSGIFILKFLLAFLYFSATFLVGYLLGYDSRQFYFLIFLSVNQFLLSFILYLRSNISALQLFKTDSLLSILDRLFMIIFCSMLIWGNFTKGKFQIEWFLYAQMAAYICTFLICLTLVLFKSHFRKPVWDFGFYIHIIKQSFPYALLILLMTFYYRVDSVMLERMLKNGSEYAGIYAAAYRLLDAFNMIAYLFAVILLPLFSRMLKTQENIQSIVRISFSLLFVFSTFVALFSAFNSTQIMSLMYVHHTAESAAVFKIIMFCFIPVSTTYVFGTLLTANGSLKVLNIIAFSGMLLNIILNLLVIPVYKTEGAAAVSLTTQCITALMQFLYVMFLFKLKHNYKFIISLVAHLCIVFIAMLTAYLCTDNIIYSFAGTCIATLTSAIVFGIFKPVKLLKLFFSL